LYKGGERNDVYCNINKNNSETKIEEYDIFIPNIKEYMFDPLANEKLNEMIKDLKATDVVADFLKVFVNRAIERLSEDKSFSGSKFYSDFKKENIRYCIACPEDKQDFMAQCFIQAEIITEEDLKRRLDFTTEAEATAYHCIAWDRSYSKISADEKYLVCDIGHRSVGISEINADTTESLSTVKSFPGHSEVGSMALENNLREYLLLQGVDNVEVERKVEEFIENTKVSTFFQ
jgi:hypothetical protein